ncbi:MAG: DMT family transporter [Pseudomonadota bacterium]
MRLLVFLVFVLIAFAGNSVLNRMALVGEGAIGALEFAMIRVLAGALVLAVFVRWRSGRRERKASTQREIRSAGALALYLLGFSLAYLSLPAGLGALILFGGVQITMFAGAVLGGEAVPRQRWIGAGLAFAGLVYLLWPSGAGAPDPLGAVLMAAAALGWGVYSLIGRSSQDPLADTARNFLLAVFPVGAAMFIAAAAGAGAEVPLRGALLGIASGAVTSGLGYALWFRVLPQLSPSVAAVAQLTVPLVAMVGGMIFLTEPLTLRFAIASAIVLGGVAFAVLAPKG